MAVSELFAGVLIVVGLWLCYRSRKRVFERTNPCGHQRFRSLAHKGVALIIDGAILFAGSVLALIGLVFLAIEHADSWGAFVLLPLLWLFIVGDLPFQKGSKRS